MEGDRTASEAAGTRKPRADQLRSGGDLARVFLRAGSGRVLTTALSAAALGRVALRRWSRADVATIAVGVAVAGPVEWVVHRHLFHAPADSVRQRRLGLGAGHALHHDDPDDLTGLLLAPVGAAALAVAAGALSATWSVPLAVILGPSAGGATAGTPSPPWLSPGPSLIRLPPTLIRVAPVVLTGVAVAWWALAHYEWFHLRSHSRWRPRSARVRRRVGDHLRHHHRDANRWFGVTSPTGDVLFGTR